MNWYKYAGIKIMPQVDPRKMKKFLRRLGFYLVRSDGKHEVFKNDMFNRTITIPMHKRDLTPSVVSSIAEQIGFSVKLFADLYKRQKRLKEEEIQMHLKENVPQYLK